jgi:hypothetical protein
MGVKQERVYTNCHIMEKVLIWTSEYTGDKSPFKNTRGVCVCVCERERVREKGGRDRESHAASPRLRCCSRRKTLNIQLKALSSLSSVKQKLGLKKIFIIKHIIKHGTTRWRVAASQNGPCSMEMVNFTGKEISRICNREVSAVSSLRVFSPLFTDFQLKLGCAYKIL